MNLTAYDNEILMAAIVIISMALIFYSVGVWSERIQGGLRGWHVVAFGLGLVCDFVGTAFMAELVRLTGQDNQLHAVLGSIAIFLLSMLFGHLKLSGEGQRGQGEILAVLVSLFGAFG